MCMWNLSGLLPKLTRSTPTHDAFRSARPYSTPWLSTWSSDGQQHGLLHRGLLIQLPPFSRFMNSPVILTSRDRPLSSWFTNLVTTRFRNFPNSLNAHTVGSFKPCRFDFVCFRLEKRGRERPSARSPHYSERAVTERRVPEGFQGDSVIRRHHTHNL